jgi:hypothetical protein
MTAGPDVAPRLAVWLLRVSLAADVFETVSGDLEEIARLDVAPVEGARAARRWYWRQTASLLARRAITPRPRPRPAVGRKQTMAARPTPSAGCGSTPALRPSPC